MIQYNKYNRWLSPHWCSYCQSKKMALFAIILQLPSFKHVKFEVPIEFLNGKVQKEHGCIDLGLTKSFWLERVWTVLLRSMSQPLDYEP